MEAPKKDQEKARRKTLDIDAEMLESKVMHIDTDLTLFGGKLG